MRYQLAHVLGVRAPNLQNGGDLQFVMMDYDDFLYDASMPSMTYGWINLERGLWPYSFDYKSIQVGSCNILIVNIAYF